MNKKTIVAIAILLVVLGAGYAMATPTSGFWNGMMGYGNGMMSNFGYHAGMMNGYGGMAGYYGGYGFGQCGGYVSGYGEYIGS